MATMADSLHIMGEDTNSYRTLCGRSSPSIKALSYLGACMSKYWEHGEDGVISHRKHKLTLCPRCQAALPQDYLT